jgi:hypothetical protein
MIKFKITVRMTDNTTEITIEAIIRTTYGDDRRTSILGPQALDDSVRLVECTDTSGPRRRATANAAVSVVELPAEVTGSAGMQSQEPQG